jgi:hypothetical protein
MNLQKDGKRPGRVGETYVGEVIRTEDGGNVAIVAAGLVTAHLYRSAWPDLIVGLGILLMNADAAREVFNAARDERRAAAP